jgi:hypothetical protein
MITPCKHVRKTIYQRNVDSYIFDCKHINNTMPFLLIATLGLYSERYSGKLQQQPGHRITLASRQFELEDRHVFPHVDL